MTRASQVLLVILLALITPGHVWGQNGSSRPEGALFLLLPVGAEGISLGPCYDGGH
jgi:hypothetical protein